jgi:hypothetical protein
MMTDEDLIALREVFRIAFKQHDFCIGEKEVERVFRRLLEEPETKDDILHQHYSLEEIQAELDKQFDKGMVEKLFHRDNVFYRILRRNENVLPNRH